MIKRNVGHHVLLVPQAYRLDKYGFEVPPGTDDDWWLIESVEDAGVTIRRGAPFLAPSIRRGGVDDWREALRQGSAICATE